MVLRIDPFGPPASLSKTGDNQSAAILNTFANPVSVRVLDASNQPLRNVVVTFTVPVNGASVLLTLSSTVSTDSNGYASVTAAANGAAGSYNVQAAAGGLSVTFSLSNLKGAQATLQPNLTPATLAYGGIGTLSSTGGSGNGAVTFAVTAGGTFCSINGTTLTATEVGTCTVTVTKAADANYNAASATLDLNIGTADQSGFAVGASSTSIALNASTTLSSSGGSGAGALSYAITNGNSFCSLSGNTLTGIAVGTCTVTATKAGDSHYNAAQSTVDISVTKAAQAAFGVNANPAALSYGGRATLSSSGGSGAGDVAYAITAGNASCSLNGTELTAIGVGTCTVTATKAGDASYLPISSTVDVVVSRATQSSLTVSANPAALGFGGSSTLSTSGGSSSGSVSYAVTTGAAFCSVVGSTLSATGVGTCTVTATKAADSSYEAVSATVDVVVSLGTQAALSLSINPGSLVLQGSATLTASGGSGNGALSFSVSSGAANCSLSGNTVTGTGVGNCTVLASKAGDAQYLPASASLVISVGKISQSISFAQLIDRVLGSADFTLGASASSGLAVSYLSLTPGLCQVNGSSVHLSAAGQCTLSASQVGDANYLAATPVTQSFTITLPAGTSTSLSGMPGGGSVSVSGGWVFAPAGNGNGATAGFIPLTGHPKSPNVAPPSGLTFPYGLFDFVVMNGTPGGTVVLTFELAAAPPANAQYWKFGPTSSNTTPHWYRFDGAQFSGRTVTLTIVDGGTGDDDLTANGSIVDGGGIAVPDPAASANAVPALDSAALAALALMMLLVLAWDGRRQRG